MSKGIEVTAVKVYPFKESPSLGHIRGMASVELNGAIRIRSLRIMSGDTGMFVGYPVDPFFKGEDYRYVVECIDDEVRQAIEKAVLAKYEELTA